jgi:beta-lactamase superfamily II metal-dependent hydrolase
MPLAPPAIVLATLLSFEAQAQSRTFDIYWVDVEGGAATLVVSPSGESLLVDSGWEQNDRDAKRIFAAARAAGLSRIDHFVLSHFHADHAGGMVALSKLMPFGRCYDRGDFIEPANQRWRDAYLSVCRDKRTILKAGDTIPLKDVGVDVVASNGELIATPLVGGGEANPLCATAENHPPDVPENQLMVGALFSYGRFRFLDLIDLDWQKEMELACPTNRIGRVTIWEAGRHGALDGAGAPGFLGAIKPQVVVVNNGPRKGLGGPTGGARQVFTDHYQRLMDIPGIEDVWQVHRSLFDDARNTAEERTANLTDTDACEGHWLKVAVRSDGTYTLKNGRTGFEKTYMSR